VVEFMAQTLLLCPIDKNTYLIPSLAKDTLLETPTSVNGLKFWLQFEYLPAGLFQRLASLLVKDQHGDDLHAARPRIHRPTAMVRVGKTDVYCEARHNLLIFQFSDRGDVLKLRNQMYQLTEIVVDKFLGQLKSPELFLVPKLF